MRIRVGGDRLPMKTVAPCERGGSSPPRRPLGRPWRNGRRDRKFDCHKLTRLFVPSANGRLRLSESRRAGPSPAGTILFAAPSSNGRTTVFETENVGSIPSGAIAGRQ